MDWPDELGAFKDIADKYYSDADESVLHTSAEAHKRGLADLQSALEEADQAYTELLGAFELDGKQSDAYAAVRERRQEFRHKGGALAAKALAGQQFMEAAAAPVRNSKSSDQDAGHKALETMQKTQFWPDWILHRAGKETHLEQARKQLEDEMAHNKDRRVQTLQGSYKPPADGEYGFDGQPTSWTDGSMGGGDLERSGNDQSSMRGGGFQQGGARQPAMGGGDLERSGSNRSSFGGGGFAYAGRDTNMHGGEYQRSGAQSASDGSSGGGQGSVGGGQSPAAVSSRAGASSGSASTGLQSGAAVAEHLASAPPPSGSPRGASAPLIGGLGAAPLGGPGQSGRIASVGG